MEEIVLSGILSEDAAKRTDKKGYEYIRFKVGCEGLDIYGEPRVTIYRCYSYDLQFANLKKGDLVFLIGSFNVNRIDGKYYCDVYVHQISRGYL